MFQDAAIQSWGVKLRFGLAQNSLAVYRMHSFLTFSQMPCRTDKKHSENVIAEVTQVQIKFIFSLGIHEVVAHSGIERTDGYTCSQQLLKGVSDRHKKYKSITTCTL